MRAKASQCPIIFFVCKTVSFQLCQIVGLNQFVVLFLCIQVSFYFLFFFFLFSYLFLPLSIPSFLSFGFWITLEVGELTLHCSYLYIYTVRVRGLCIANGHISPWLCTRGAIGIFPTTVRVWILFGDRDIDRGSSKGIL